MTIARSSGWMRIAVEIICSLSGCPGKFLCEVARGCSDWIGPDGRGAVGRAVAEFGGDDQSVLGVRPCSARARKCVFVEVAGGGKLVVGEFDGVQFRAHGSDGLAVIRLDADVDIVSFDGACVVDGKFQVVLPKEVEWSGSAEGRESSGKNTPVQPAVSHVFLRHALGTWI